VLEKLVTRHLRTKKNIYQNVNDEGNVGTTPLNTFVCTDLFYNVIRHNINRNFKPTIDASWEALVVAMLH
jgi:hypothetical protein